jgi:hypothetical protein
MSGWPAAFRSLRGWRVCLQSPQRGLDQGLIARAEEAGGPNLPMEGLQFFTLAALGIDRGQQAITVGECRQPAPKFLQGGSGGVAGPGETDIGTADFIKLETTGLGGAQRHQ